MSLFKKGNLIEPRGGPTTENRYVKTRITDKSIHVPEAAKAVKNWVIRFHDLDGDAKKAVINGKIALDSREWIGYWKRVCYNSYHCCRVLGSEIAVERT